MIFISCLQSKGVDEEMVVIGYIYNSIPKTIPPPPPPPPMQNSDFDSIDNQFDYSKLDSLYFRYAINNQFVISDLNKEINKSFFKANSEKLFEREDIDSLNMALIKKIGNVNTKKNLNKEFLNNYVGKNSLYLNQRFISKDGKEKKELNIDGIISFSRVSFNAKKNRAAIVVGIHRGRLDSSSTIYLLEKINENWSIKYYSTIEIS